MNTLIDRAIKRAGSVNAVGELLHIPANLVSMMKNVRKISPETAAELANISGDDPVEAAIEAMLERAKGTRREIELVEILAPCLSRRRSQERVFELCKLEVENNSN